MKCKEKKFVSFSVEHASVLMFELVCRLHVIHFLFLCISFHFDEFCTSLLLLLFTALLLLSLPLLLMLSLLFICFSCISTLSAFKEAMSCKWWPVQMTTTSSCKRCVVLVCSRCVTLLQINKRYNARAFEKCRLVKYLTASPALDSHTTIFQPAHDYFNAGSCLLAYLTWNSYWYNEMQCKQSIVILCDGNYYDDDPLHCCAGLSLAPFETNFSCFVHCIRHCKFIVPHVHSFCSSKSLLRFSFIPFCPCFF